MFFFSSRRRHTRSKRDWSSDVCSSDLYNALSCYESISATVSQNFVGWNMMLGYTRTQNNTDDSLRWRSEERRVGKEGRYVWEAEDWKRRDKDKVQKGREREWMTGDNIE